MGGVRNPRVEALEIGYLDAPAAETEATAAEEEKRGGKKDEDV